MQGLDLARIGMAEEVGGLDGALRLAEARHAAHSARAGKVEEAAAMFESLLAAVLVKEMRQGLGQGFFGSGAGADVFEGWLDEHLGNALAQSGALDVAGFIRANLEHKQAAGGAVASGIGKERS
jgi:Rod binding domain-containing protein